MMNAGQCKKEKENKGFRTYIRADNRIIYRQTYLPPTRLSTISLASQDVSVVNADIPDGCTELP
jgi:hypothetical protein